MNHETARRIAFAHIGRGTCRISDKVNFRAVGKLGLFETTIDPYESSTFPIQEIHKSIEEILIQTQSIYMLDNQEWLAVSSNIEYEWEEFDFTEELENYKALQNGAILAHAGSLYITNKECTVAVKKKTHLKGSYFIPFGHSRGLVANVQNEGRLITIIKNELGIFANKQFIAAIVEAANLLSHEKVKMSEDLAEFINSSIEITGVVELYDMGFSSSFSIEAKKMTLVDTEGTILYDLEVPIDNIPARFDVDVGYWNILSPKKVQIPKSRAVVIYCKDKYDNFAAIAPRKWWTD